MYNITLIPGDGIGPEITEAVKEILKALNIDINWDIQKAGKIAKKETGDLIPESVYESIEKNKVVLKGPITTPIGSGFRSINVHLRKKYNLFANIRPVKTIGNLDLRYDNIDLTIFRENIEGLYAGIEKVISDEEIHAIKKVTKTGCKNIITEAFEYAKKNDLKKVTVAHKANILKKADGLFLDTAREISKKYKDIELEEVIIDNMCMQLVKNPEKFNLIVTTNLYGDILSDLAAGLVGGLGLIPGANIGKDKAIFEAVHGSAPDIAGKKIANPTALLRSAIMMLKYLGEDKKASDLSNALEKVYTEKLVLTKDLGGESSTKEFSNEIIKNLGG
ncbi:MAG: isocitrate/isopropylmalate dehydrogenase family protein [Bacillota bacterium]